MFATIYVICLILGGGMLLLSMVFSGDSADAGIDGHASADAVFDHGAPDLDHDLSGAAGHDATGETIHGHAHSHHSGFSLASWFSVQFVVYFLAVFGLVGTTLTYASGVGPGVTMVSAIFGGALVGQGVHQLVRLLKKTGQGSEISSIDFLDKPARVTINIEPARRGEVAVPLHSGERFVAAAAKRPDDKFRVGDRVVVVNFRNGVAEVVSRQEYEFTSGRELGAST